MTLAEIEEERKRQLCLLQDATLDYADKALELKRKLCYLDMNKECQLIGIDWPRIVLASEYISIVNLHAVTVEMLDAAIDDAITGYGLLKHSYIGLKSYYGFEDQRCDCEYGYGPKHGTIISKISLSAFHRKHLPTTEKLDDILYYLNMCKRDDFRKLVYDHDLKMKGAQVEWRALREKSHQL